LGSEPALRRRIASAAARQVRQRWLWPRLVERMRAVYRELVPELPRRARAIPPPTAAVLHALAAAP
jgi:hypothetical protein